MAGEMNDLVREFLAESRENLDQVDLDLVALEKSPEDGSIVARIFRAVHTIKGTCGFLGFGRLEAVSHAGENVLSALRDEEIAATPTLTSVLLAMVDVIRSMLARIEATGDEGDGDHSVLVEQLGELYRGGTPVLAPASAPPAPVAAVAPVEPVAAPDAPVAAPIAAPIAPAAAPIAPAAPEPPPPAA